MVSINKIKLSVNDELFFPANLSITAIRQTTFMCVYKTAVLNEWEETLNISVRFRGFQKKFFVLTLIFLKKKSTYLSIYSLFEKLKC